jgi:ParB-like chromosome segregation protein Spo0J
MEANVIRVRPDQVKDSQKPTRPFAANKGEIEVLACSLLEGQLSPIVVMESPDGYDLVSGRQRLEAAKLIVTGFADKLPQPQFALLARVVTDPDSELIVRDI